MFFIQISGELLLNDAGLTSGPLVDITGSVMLTVGAGPVFTLSANGTVFVYKVGNIASGAAYFVLNASAGLSQPKFYGVLKLDTNFGFLKPYGITAQATAVLEINTTAQIQTVQIALQGIPGDQLFTDPNTGDVANLPQSLGGSAPFNSSIAANLLALFSQNGITLDDSSTNKSDPAPTVTAESDPVTGNLMWIITSVINGVTSRFYIRNIPADSSAGTAAHLEIDTEVQTFNIRPQTFLLQISGQLTVAESGTTYFTIRGAIQIEISNAGFQFFAFAEIDLSGSSLAKIALIAVDPVLAAVTFVNVTALFDIVTQTPAGGIPGVAGYLQISLSLGTGNLSSGLNGINPNVNFTGSFQLLFNTTLSEIVYDIPNQFLSDLGPTDPTTITIPATPPRSPLFTLDEPNSKFPDAGTLPQKAASPVPVPSNWANFFAQQGSITLSSNATVQLYSDDASGNAYSWQVVNGNNVYTITKQYPIPDSGTPDELVVETTAGQPSVYLQLRIQGNLDLFNEINLAGSFTLTAQSTGTVTSLVVAGIVAANVPLLGTLTGTINFTVQISTDPTQATGLWGSATLQLALGGLIPGVSMSRTVELLVNASNQAQDLTGYVNQHTKDSNGVEQYALGTIQDFEPGIEIQINGSIEIGNLLDLSGEFDFTLQLAGPNPGLTISANAGLTMQPFGTLAVSGVLSVNSQGLIVALNISLNPGFGANIGISFSGSATLDLNTSSSTRPTTSAARTSPCSRASCSPSPDR